MNDVDWRNLWRRYVTDAPGAEPWNFTLARFRADVEARMRTHGETLEKAAREVGQLWQDELEDG